MLACGLLPGTRGPVWQGPDGRSVLGPKTGEEQRMDELTRKGEDISEEVTWAGGQSLVSQPIIYGLLPIWIRQTISVGLSVAQLSTLFPLSVCPGPERKQLGLSVLCNTGLAKTRPGISSAAILISFTYSPQVMSNKLHGGDPRKLRNSFVFQTKGAKGILPIERERNAARKADMNEKNVNI